jgi:hypothetical protein
MRLHAARDTGGFIFGADAERQLFGGNWRRLSTGKVSGLHLRPGSMLPPRYAA